MKRKEFLKLKYLSNEEFGKHWEEIFSDGKPKVKYPDKETFPNSKAKPNGEQNLQRKEEFKEKLNKNKTNFGSE